MRRTHATFAATRTLCDSERIVIVTLSPLATGAVPANRTRSPVADRSITSPNGHDNPTAGKRSAPRGLSACGPCFAFQGQSMG